MDTFLALSGTLSRNYVEISLELFGSFQRVDGQFQSFPMEMDLDNSWKFPLFNMDPRSYFFVDTESRKDRTIIQTVITLCLPQVMLTFLTKHIKVKCLDWPCAKRRSLTIVRKIINHGWTPFLHIRLRKFKYRDLYTWQQIVVKCDLCPWHIVDGSRDLSCEEKMLETITFECQLNQSNRYWPRDHAWSEAMINQITNHGQRPWYVTWPTKAGDPDYWCVPITVSCHDWSFFRSTTATVHFSVCDCRLITVGGNPGPHCDVKQQNQSHVIHWHAFELADTLLTYAFTSYCPFQNWINVVSPMLIFSRICPRLLFLSVHRFLRWLHTTVTCAWLFRWERHQYHYLCWENNRHHRYLQSSKQMVLEW